MKKNIKTSEILNIYNVINNAKYSKMEDADKIKVWKICRVLKPIATKFDEDSKDAAEKFKADIKDSDERLSRAQEYLRLKDAHEPTIDVMTTAEFETFQKEWNNFNSLVQKAVQEFADKEVEIDFTPITEDAFGKLLSSNEWTMAQATALGDFICE